jgi:DNA replication protein DnaC
MLLAQTPRPTGWLTFFGDYGKGKSGILKSLIAAFIRASVKAKYIRANDILTMVKASFSKDAETTEQDIAESLMRYQVIAIDEVDRIPATDWARATLFSILDRRYNTRKTCATIFATNMTPDRMPQEWKYLMSRMKDGLRVPVGGEDLRGISKGG